MTLFIKNRLRTSLLCALVALLVAPVAVSASERVLMKTSKGAIEIELDPAKAPVTVANFLKYVDARYYDGLTFHRVIEGFMIQGGGYDENLTMRAPNAPIANESANGLGNVIGSVAMARLNAPDSATAQFFINVANNTQLDYNAGRPGYTVFGHVASGMDVVRAIAAVKTGTANKMEDVPVQPVIIFSVRRVDAKNTP